MEFLSPIIERLSRMPPFLWMLGAIGIGALVAIFVFSVSVGAVANYSLLAPFWGGHMFMHGSHVGMGEKTLIRNTTVKMHLNHMLI